MHARMQNRCHGCHQQRHTTPPCYLIRPSASSLEQPHQQQATPSFPAAAPTSTRPQLRGSLIRGRAQSAQHAPSTLVAWRGVRQGLLASTAAVAASSTSPSTADRGLSALHGAQPGDLLQARPMLSTDTDEQDKQPCEGDLVWLEIISSWDAATASCSVLWEGRILQLTASNSQPTSSGSMLQVRQTGTCITSPGFKSLVSAFPALAKLAVRLNTPLPWTQLTADSVQVVANLTKLEQQVQLEPSQYCGGTAPGAPLPTGLAYQLQSAGELLALLTGARGLVMVQLWVGWDAGLGQPVLNTFVLTLLKRVAASKELAAVISSIQGGMGVTALVHANKEPWRSYAKHMASFGAQAALVAGSPYYQLLIGRMLGYPEEHIHYHIRSQAGRPGFGTLTPQVIATVDADLQKISSKKPTLPWNSTSRKKTKNK